MAADIKEESEDMCALSHTSPLMNEEQVATVKVEHDDSEGIDMASRLCENNTTTIERQRIHAVCRCDYLICRCKFAKDLKSNKSAKKRKISKAPAASPGESCALCKTSLSDGQRIVQLGIKGSEGVNRASRLRGNDIRTVEGQSVHVECRRKYTNISYIESSLKRKDSQEPGQPTSVELEVEDEYTLDWFKEHCFYCRIPKKRDKYMKPGYSVSHVRTGPGRIEAALVTLEGVCKERNDSWGETVNARIQRIRDLQATDIIYHNACSTSFRSNRNIPARFREIKKFHQTTRTGNECPKQQAFIKVCDFLQNFNEEEITIEDLVQKMEAWCDGKAYSAIDMENKLLAKFGNNICISNVNGKATVVYFKPSASQILNLYFSRQKSTNTEVEKTRLIEAAGRLIKSEIQCLPDSERTYASSSEVEANAASQIPESLQLFLRSVMNDKDDDNKIASIGKSVIQAAQPKYLFATCRQDWPLDALTM